MVSSSLSVVGLIKAIGLASRASRVEKKMVHKRYANQDDGELEMNTTSSSFLCRSLSVSIEKSFSRRCFNLMCPTPPLASPASPNAETITILGLCSLRLAAERLYSPVHCTVADGCRCQFENGAIDTPKQ